MICSWPCGATLFGSAATHSVCDCADFELDMFCLLVSAVLLADSGCRIVLSAVSSWFCASLLLFRSALASALRKWAAVVLVMQCFGLSVAC